MSRNYKQFMQMTEAERLVFMATGKVSVSSIWQVDKESPKPRLKRFFVAKVRGITVSDGDTWQHETEDAAKTFGEKILNTWKRDLLQKVSA